MFLGFKWSYLSTVSKNNLHKVHKSYVIYLGTGPQIEHIYVASPQIEKQKIITLKFSS